MAPTVEEKRLRVLHSKKEYLFKSLQTLFDLTKKLDDSVSREKFLKLVGSVERTRVDLVELLDKINLLSLEIDEKFEPKYDLMDTVEEMCGHVREAERLLSASLDRGPKYCEEQAGCKGNATRGALKLKKVDLPYFSGDLKDWGLFYELFKSLVHENRELSDMDKLYYLIGCLKGPAKNICAGLSMTADNYEVIWDALIERYQDTRALANAYLGQILDWRDTREESEKGLVSFLESFDAFVRALRKLKIRDLADFMFFYHALSKLNPQTANYFEINRHSNSVPQYEELLEFVKLRVKTLATIKTKCLGRPREFESSKSKLSKSFVENKSHSSDPEMRCEYCRRSGHNLSACLPFLGLKPKLRYSKVKDLNLCYNCFSADHGVRNCPSPAQCDSCMYKHHKLIHHERAVAKPADAASEKKEDERVSLNVSGCNEVGKATGILLGTAKVEVEGPFGCCRGRFLIDSGSQANLITRRFCRQLGLPISKVASSIQGLGGMSQPVRGLTHFTVLVGPNRTGSFLVSALVVEKVTGNLPHSRVDFRINSWLKNLPLADSDFGQPGPIEGIFGAEIFTNILRSNHVKGVNGGPMALETSLGYVVIGRIPAKQKSEERHTFLSILEAPPVEQLVKQFWEMEVVPETKGGSSDDEKCEHIFRKESFRDETGRFTVALPFKLEPSQLGDSRNMAKRRYFALESRLNKNVELKEGYHKAMRDFIDQGHIYPIREKNDATPSYYIPHHAVYKASSSTPVRIVLDASAPTDNGLSLNSVLYIGPKLQADIGSLLIRFRLFPVAMIGDIKQMYRQINVVQSHRRFQRIFWRWSPDDPLDTWELGTLAFGVSSSPYLALRCVRELLQQEKHCYPKSAEWAEESLYMDDLVVSVPTVKEAEILFVESVELFKKAQFELTKWISNSDELLDKIPVSSRVKGETSVSFKGQTSVLGLIWNPQDDVILINFPAPALECTKRSILSSVARCFDPIGISAPLTLHLKVLVKELWTLKLDWDEEAPSSIQQRWRRIQAEWQDLKTFRVRRSWDATRETSVKLLGFADASKEGYGGVIYLQKEDDHSALQLVCAKSRVSPIKAVSIPRMELCAALLLTNLMVYVVELLKEKIKVSELFAFSDSSTVLQWLQSDELKDVFVRNRILRIRELLPQLIWSHIAGKDNPADGLSRGMSPTQLVRNQLWIQGPLWAQLSEEEWPCVKFGSASENSQTLTIIQDENKDSESHPLLNLVEKKSSWIEILRITVWVLRWVKRLPKGTPILASDLQVAEKILVTLVQQNHFADDIGRLQAGKDASNRLKNLHPFLHEGVLRVGGRLANSNLAFQKRHPVILPKGHLAERIIDYYHRKYLHTGAYLVEALLRQKFWILGGRSLIKKRVRMCNRCFRANPRPTEPLMADLPEQRVNPSPAFYKTGVDYFGPFSITLGRKRGATTMKAYVALFVCMAVKAIHLELVSSLSTEHFLQAFKRFLARRGSCKVIYSDRGTNFVGAQRALSQLAELVYSKEFQETIGPELAARQIEWKFNPAAAPHMGGIWESQVKAVKRHLIRVIGDQLLSYEELNTLLVQIEALLNSRPLCQLSTDPSAPSALTPAHFVHSAPLEELPAENLLAENPNRLSRFQLLNQMVQSFWKRWQLEYLSTLQTRKRWSEGKDNLRVGTVAVLKVENTPPLRWPLVLITEVFPGRDGIVRTVKVRCGHRDLIRPAVKICPLPTQ